MTKPDAEPKVGLDLRSLSGGNHRPDGWIADCGTKAGYESHKRRDEAPCAACKTANADYSAKRRFRSGFHTDPRRCRGCGSVFPEHRCWAADLNDEKEEDDR